MNIFDRTRSAIAAVAAALVFNLDAHAIDDPDATTAVDEYSIERPEGAGEVELLLVGSDGRRVVMAFGPEEPLLLDRQDIAERSLADGSYAWEARFRPILDDEQQALRDARSETGEGEIPSLVASLPPASGSLRLVDGRFLVSPDTSDEPDEDTPNPLPPTRDQVINDDLIVLFSACIGNDCVNGEAFGADSLRLKENTLRIHFDDTSTASGFPANKWRLVANDQNSGGANYFAIEDATAGRVPFRVDAGAPASSIHVVSNGSVGFGTATPAVELHAANGDSPTLRLDQTGAAGFTPQIWDVAGNETNFFIRDSTGGSRLPFKIRPGARTDALVIDAQGEIAMGRPNAEAALHITQPAAPTVPFLTIDTSDGPVMNLDADGNLFVGGAITQLSSRTAKENLVSVAGEAVLDRLAELPIWTWNYLASGRADRHIGPVAEDFYASFGFGTSERSLSPSDMAGVALAASKALNEQLDREIEQRDRHIESLEARLARLERLLLDSEPTAGRDR